MAIAMLHEILAQRMAKHGRLILYPKDVVILLGKSDRTARTVMAKIRRACGKAKHQPVSVADFCNYMGLDRKEVESVLAFCK